MSQESKTPPILNCTPKVGHHQQKGCSFIMTKHSKEKKIAAIKTVEAGESITKAAKQYGISDSVLKWEVRNYREHGEKGLKSHVYSWTGKQKYEALKYMHENQMSFTETGILLGIRHSTILHWERRYLENGIEGLENKKKGRKPRTLKPKPPKTREEELLERIEDLEIENEYLKKLNALVAEREKRERGNR
jgi:transposase